MRVDPDLQTTLDGWCRIAATMPRAHDYTISFPDGRTLSAGEELALQQSTAGITSVAIKDVRAEGDRATATFDCRAQATPFRWEVDFEKRDGNWLAVRSRIVQAERPATPRPHAADWLRRVVAKVKPQRHDSGLYLPYRPGQDFALPRTTPPDPHGELPMPPESLWLGYNYPVHGKQHVAAMLDILHASDFAFREGDRILDFGCGAGRMIRHLQFLADTCEVWGTDISSEHILWCKRHLSPPFRFATTTKVPHLPFADASFRFVYCGSVFTHIDDLADAWLLELRRILAPDGRLFATIHDNHTIELIEGAKGNDHWLHFVRSRQAYRDFKDSFDMIAIGRDHDSQVFYDRDYFRRMAGQSFEVLSVTPEAYFYQTAFLLKPR